MDQGRDGLSEYHFCKSLVMGYPGIRQLFNKLVIT